MCALSVRIGSIIARLFILLWHVRWWSFAILVETFLSAGLLIPEACIPIASAVPHCVPFSHVSMISFSTRVRADHEGIATPSPHEVNAQDRDADEESEEDEVVDRHVVAIAGVSGVIVAI
jgi:hypothetical protein